MQLCLVSLCDLLFAASLGGALCGCMSGDTCVPRCVVDVACESARVWMIRCVECGVVVVGCGGSPLKLPSSVFFRVWGILLFV